MNTEYIALSGQFDKEYENLIQRIDNQFEKVADAIYRQAKQKVVFIELDVPLCVGEYEELYSCYPTLDKIKVVGIIIELKLSVLKEFEPLLDFDTLSISDKRAILEYLENYLLES